VKKKEANDEKSQLSRWFQRLCEIFFQVNLMLVFVIAWPLKAGCTAFQCRL